MSKTDEKKVVLAYSGGLDTSCILVWLREQGYDVIAYLANLGQEEDYEAAREKAKKLGAVEVVIEDLRQNLIEQFAWVSVQGNCVYENRYLLGTSLARPCIVQGIVNAAKKYNAGYISHGATGKGNDQVRFEFGVAALLPKAKIVAPWRDPAFYQRFRGRQDLFEYAKQNGIPLPVTPKSPWSIDGNLIHVSYESGILEDPAKAAPDGLCEVTTDPEKAPNSPRLLTIKFTKGIPSGLQVEGKTGWVTNSLELFNNVNSLAAAHGVGRIDIVENRFLGLKSRGVYETPGLTVFLAAHLDLESVCLDREMRKIKTTISGVLSEQIYNGLWFSPECTYTRECVEASQRLVSGTVTVKLYKGSVSVVSRQASPGCNLYNAGLVSMDQHSGYDPTDATGFIAIHGLRLREYMRATN